MEHTGSTAKIAKDPICGMNVDPAKAAATIEYEGHPYYFCSKGCAAKFQQAPAKFLAASAATTGHGSTSPHAHDQIAPASLTQIADTTPSNSSLHTRAAEKSVEGVRYTCPMHPQIVQVGPGSCPICGMALEPMDPLAAVEADPEYDSMRKRFVVALVLSIPLLVLSMGGDSLLRGVPVAAMQWIELLLATPVVLWCGWPFFQRFWASLVNRSPNMFTLIGLGTGAAYFYSAVAVVFPQIFPPAVRLASGAIPSEAVRDSPLRR